MRIVMVSVLMFGALSVRADNATNGLRHSRALCRSSLLIVG